MDYDLKLPHPLFHILKGHVERGAFIEVAPVLKALEKYKVIKNVYHFGLSEAHLDICGRCLGEGIYKAVAPVVGILQQQVSKIDAERDLAAKQSVTVPATATKRKRR